MDLAERANTSEPKTAMYPIQRGRGEKLPSAQDVADRLGMSEGRGNARGAKPSIRAVDRNEDMRLGGLTPALLAQLARGGERVKHQRGELKKQFRAVARLKMLWCQGRWCDYSDLNNSGKPKYRKRWLASVATGAYPAENFVHDARVIGLEQPYIHSKIREGLSTLELVYKRAPRKAHPDFGGTHELFIKVRRSYVILAKQLYGAEV